MEEIRKELENKPYLLPFFKKAKGWSREEVILCVELLAKMQK